MQLTEDGKSCYMPAMKTNRVLFSKVNRFLDAVTLSSEKRLLASCLCIRLFVQVYQTGSRLTDFREFRDYYENPSKISNLDVGRFHVRRSM